MEKENELRKVEERRKEMDRKILAKIDELVKSTTEKTGIELGRKELLEGVEFL